MECEIQEPTMKATENPGRVAPSQDLPTAELLLSNVSASNYTNIRGSPVCKVAVLKSVQTCSTPVCLGHVDDMENLFHISL